MSHDSSARVALGGPRIRKIDTDFIEGVRREVAVVKEYKSDVCSYYQNVDIAVIAACRFDFCKGRGDPRSMNFTAHELNRSLACLALIFFLIPLKRAHQAISVAKPHVEQGVEVCIVISVVRMF